MSFAQIDDRQLYYERRGAGPRLLFVNGSGGASYPLHTLDILSPDQRARLLIPLLDTRKDDIWQNENPASFAVMFKEMAEAFRNEDGALPKGLQLQLDARSRHDTWDRLGRLKMPVYVCGGKYGCQCYTRRA